MITSAAVFIEMVLILGNVESGIRIHGVIAGPFSNVHLLGKDMQMRKIMADW